MTARVAACHNRPAILRYLALLLVIQAGLIAWSATRHSPVFDEIGHLAAGLHHWETGSFDLYRVNPPLVRLVATAPLALLGVDLPPEVQVATTPSTRAEFRLGKLFVNRHGFKTFWYFAVARWACVPFALLTTTFIFLWSATFYGRTAGLVSAGLWVIFPDTLAHAQLITPDTGAAAFGLAAGYFFWRWLRRPGWAAAMIMGVALGLALLCKLTWIVFAPVLVGSWIAYRVRAPAAEAGWRIQASQLTSAALVALYILNAGYGFEGSGTRLGAFPFISQSLTVEDSTGCRVNRFAGTWLSDLPVPLPRNYVQGIDVQKRDFELGMRSYLRGEWRTQGWWYYYLYGLLVKTPVGTLVVFVLALLSSLLPSASRPNWREELVLLLPGLAVLTLVSSQTGFNHHLRYVLPGLPFFFIWASRAVSYAGPLVPLWRATVATAVAATVASSLAVYPHGLSYFNELAGGPARGSEHLVNSNLDWGQDLLYLKEWYDAHLDARPFHLAYFGSFDPGAAGIEFTPPPNGPVAASHFLRPQAEGLGPRPGWFAVSINLLRGADSPIPNGSGGTIYVDDSHYTYFLKCKPVAQAGYSINIYHLDATECDQLRAELGLPAVSSNPTELTCP
jgi:hypothetical protein